MQKAIFSLALLAAILIASMLFAQDKKFEFIVGGGIESPLKPDAFNDGFNLGWTGKLAAGYFLTPQFTVGANLSYNRFGLDKDYFLKQVPGTGTKVSGGDLAIYEFAGVGKYYLLDPSRGTNFYMMGGPGLALSKASDLKVTTSQGTTTEKVDTESDFMLTGGFGITQQLNSRWSLFFEGRYSYLFTESDNSTYLPVRIGLLF
jgi:opacity protein-like surface antigen